MISFAVEPISPPAHVRMPAVLQAFYREPLVIDELAYFTEADYKAMRAAVRAIAEGDDDEDELAEREAEAMAELDEPEEPPKPELEYPCELCKERERMRTLPYCEECAREQGYL